VEHAKWFGRCSFLNMMKSKKFIDDVLRGGEATPEPEKEDVTAQPVEDPSKVFFKKRLPGLGSEPGIFCFRLFSLSITLPLSHSGSPGSFEGTLCT
jgi:hypothetical protein